MWLCKKIFVKNFRNINRKTPLLEFLFKNFIKKRLGAFLWILRNFQEHLFRKISGNAFFWLTCDDLKYKLLSSKYMQAFEVFTNNVSNNLMINNNIAKHAWPLIQSAALFSIITSENCENFRTVLLWHISRQLALPS